MRQIQGKLVLLQVSGEFELPRVRVIGVQLYFVSASCFFGWASSKLNWAGLKNPNLPAKKNSNFDP